MYTFIKAFLNRGYKLVFSYVSWQAKHKDFERLMVTALVLIFFGLGLSFML